MHAFRAKKDVMVLFYLILENKQIDDIRRLRLICLMGQVLTCRNNTCMI